LVSSLSRCSAYPPQSKILIRACLQTTTEHTTENRETGDSTPYLHAGYWHRHAGDGGGVEGDDAAVSPSPVACRRLLFRALGLLPRQLVAAAPEMEEGPRQLVATAPEMEEGPRDDALVSPVTGSAPPSPVLLARALLPR
jgi:hypothetical protein